MLSKTQIVTADGATLPLRDWAPEERPTAVLLALHGFNDYSNFFDAPGRYLAEHGIHAYAYDQRGFGATANVGLWAGTETYRADLRTAVQLLRRQHPDLPLYVLGESMGGAVALTALASDTPPKVDGIILAAPAVWARSTWPVYQRAALWVGAHLVPWLPVSGRGLNIQPSDNIEMLRALGRDPLVIKETRIDAAWGLANLMDEALAAAPRLRSPALIQYGSQDEIIPGRPFERLVAGLTDPGFDGQVLALYDSGYHMLLRDKQAERVWLDIRAWIETPDQPLPSAADLRARLRLGK